MVMKYNINSTEYNIPSIPMIEGNYRYAKEVTCNCGGDERFYESVNHWTCDGIYDGSIGQLICFTCNRCGDKFCFHVRDLEAWANLGVFDKFVVKVNGELFETEDVAFPKLNDKRINEVLSKCNSLEHALFGGRYTTKEAEEAGKRTAKILSIFNHHFNGHRYLYGAMLLQYNKNKKFSDDLFKYKNIVTTEFNNICDFIAKVDNNEYPQEVSLWDRNDYVIYTAVTVDRIPKLKQLLKRSEINNEIKRLKEIVKNGGAYYYKDMLDELKNFDGETPKVGSRYYITD